MNNSMGSSNTSAFYFMAWASFMISTVGMLLGIYHIPAPIWVKGYLGLGYLFTVTSCLTLAKTLRDKHEEERFVNRVKHAKTEKILSDFEKVA